ncbi:hypothetical protein DV737_g468, partial [Chaetothyriales sp. CBS 132003]
MSTLGSLTRQATGHVLGRTITGDLEVEELTALIAEAEARLGDGTPFQAADQANDVGQSAPLDQSIIDLRGAGADVYAIAREARQIFRDFLPDGVLREEERRVYTRLYGEPLPQTEQATRNDNLEDGAQVDGPAFSSEALASSDAESTTSLEERAHPFTTLGKGGTTPSTIFLPKRTFGIPLQSILGDYSNRQLKETSEQTFGGPGLPDSPLTPRSGRSRKQVPVPLQASQVFMGEMEANAFLTAVMPPAYAAITSVLVETRKRLGQTWLTELLAKEGGARVLDAGAGGAGILAWNEVVNAHWESVHSADASPPRTPTTRAVVLTGSDPLRHRSAALLENTTFLPRLPDYVHARDKPTLDDERSTQSRKQFDVIISAYSLLPFKEDWEKKQYVQNLWSLLRPTGGILILIEKGMPRGFEAVAGARDMLLERYIATPEGHSTHYTAKQSVDEDAVHRPLPGMIVAPCTNHEKCPMYRVPGESRGRKDFCSFQQRYIRPPPMQRVLGARDRNHDDVDFSYVSVMKGRDLRERQFSNWNHLSDPLSSAKTASGARAQSHGNTDRWRQECKTGFATTTPDTVAAATDSGTGLPPTHLLPRVILAPLKRQGHVMMDVCTPLGTLERWTVPRSFSKQAFRDARKAQWGDLWALGAKTTIPRKLRLGAESQENKSIRGNDERKKRKALAILEAKEEQREACTGELDHPGQEDIDEEWDGEKDDSEDGNEQDDEALRQVWQDIGVGDIELPARHSAAPARQKARSILRPRRGAALEAAERPIYGPPDSEDLATRQAFAEWEAEFDPKSYARGPHRLQIRATKSATREGKRKYRELQRKAADNGLLWLLDKKRSAAEAEHLEPGDIIAAQRVSSCLGALARDNKLWRTKCFEKAPGATNPARSQTRSVTTWDQTAADERIDWYSEYIARHAPLSTVWCQSSQDIRGIALHNDCHGHAQHAVGCLDDGSVAIWDISQHHVGRRKFHQLAQTAPGLLFAQAASPRASTSTTLAPGFSGLVDCITLDSSTHKAYIAVGQTLNEIDLRTFRVISQNLYPWPITALSTQGDCSVPLSVGTSWSLHLFDPRASFRHRSRSPNDMRCAAPAEPEASIAYLANYTKDQSHSGMVARPQLPSPTADSLSQMLQPQPMRRPRIELSDCAQIEPGPQSILHNGDHEILIAGRFPSIVSYDRRCFPRVDYVIHSGARLSCLASIPHPPKAACDSTRATSTLIAGGEYNGRGSLELYSLSSRSQERKHSSDDLDIDGPGPGLAAPAGESELDDRSSAYSYRNRQQASSAKILSVASVGSRIVFSDAEGGIRWVERDGRALARRWNINAYHVDHHTGSGAPAGDLVARKIVPVVDGGTFESPRGTRGDGDLLVFTGEKVGIITTKPQYEDHDELVRAFDDNGNEQAQDDREKSALYSRTMRLALERQADERRWMSRFRLKRGVHSS